jgi:hypothetical protein
MNKYINPKLSFQLHNSKQLEANISFLFDTLPFDLRFSI